MEPLRSYVRLSFISSLCFVCHFISSAQALVLAVMPRDSSNGVEEANAFLEHVQTTYPETAAHWQALDSEGDFMEMVNDEDYASAEAGPGFSFGIVFSSGSPDFEYKVQNSVSVAPRIPASRSLPRSLGCFPQQAYNGGKWRSLVRRQLNTTAPWLNCP